MEITQIKEEELADLAQLYQQLIPNDISIESMQEVIRNNRDNAKHVVLAAKIDGQLVGTLLAGICEMLFGQCKSFMVVEDVVVDSEYRQQGVGRALMQYVEEYARNHNCSYIMLRYKCDHSWIIPPYSLCITLNKTSLRNTISVNQRWAIKYPIRNGATTPTWEYTQCGFRACTYNCLETLTNKIASIFMTD